MEYVLRDKGDVTFVEITDKQFIISEEQDALDLAALCGENGTDRLLVGSENLDDRFYNLKTGLAGAVLQKFSNYRILFAAVVAPDKLTGRFGELALEAGKGKSLRFFTGKNDAERWISGQG